MFDLVIFDLDGLLVDSEPLQFRAYREAFAGHGIDLDYEDWPRWHLLEASARRWIEAHGLDLDAERIRAEKKQIYEQLIASELELKPGARALVEQLAGSCRLCVASGSRRESISACLERFGLEDHFEGLFSATLLARKKPYPDVYLHTLAQTRVAAERALAIEDSPAGLRAAIAAGLSCVVCPDSFSPAAPAELEAATMIVDSLEQLNRSTLSRLAVDTMS